VRHAHFDNKFWKCACATVIIVPSRAAIRLRSGGTSFRDFRIFSSLKANIMCKSVPKVLNKVPDERCAVLIDVRGHDKTHFSTSNVPM